MERQHDHLIIGGGIAGVTAAETIRQRDADATIAVVGAEPHPLYSRVMLPHVADGRVRGDRAVLKTVEALAAKGIAYAMGAEARRVDAAARSVILADGRVLSYRNLLVASGGTARRFDGPGGELCFHFRTLADLPAFEAAVAAGRVVVYGGSFNALDLAMSLARRGAEVTSVVRGEGFLARIADADGMAAVAKALVGHGIRIVPRTELRAVESAGRGRIAYLSDGSRLECGAVGASIGVIPNVAFLEGSGVPTGNGVLTDERLCAAPGVFAAGDAAEFMDVRVGERRIAGNWQNAMFQGRTAGMNMAGDDVEFDLVTQYSIPVFDLPVCVLGAADARGLEAVSRRTAAGAVLRLFLKDGRMVGAVCIGPFAERASLTRLIASRRPLSSAERHELLAGDIGRIAG